jgi:hypothetical protein
VRELVEYVEHAILPSIVGAILDKVIGPDVIGTLRPYPDTGPIGQPKTAPFGLFGWDLQPLPFPDPLDSPITDRPTRLTQQGSHLAVAIAAILPGQLNHIGGQPCGVFSAPRHLALRRAMLSERRTGTALGHI